MFCSLVILTMVPGAADAIRLSRLSCCFVLLPVLLLGVLGVSVPGSLEEGAYMNAKVEKLITLKLMVPSSLSTKSSVSYVVSK